MGYGLESSIGIKLSRKSSATSVVLMRRRPQQLVILSVSKESTNSRDSTSNAVVGCALNLLLHYADCE
jgi:hypothetical protein